MIPPLVHQPSPPSYFEMSRRFLSKHLGFLNSVHRHHQTLSLESYSNLHPREVLVPPPPKAPTVQKSIRYKLPAVLMRSGTSKGLFLHRHHLPALEAAWAPILLSAMGSENGDERQLDGVGGATSTTSKVVVVSKSLRPDIDVEYTFVQVAVGKKKIDLSGNCGNMASGIGAFALDEGLVHPFPGQAELDIRILNLNTQRVVTETVQVSSDGRFLEEGNCEISGVKSRGSPIKIAFQDAAGSMCGTMFPTGNRQDELTITMPEATASIPFTVRATLIDVANPFIFVDSSSLPPIYHTTGPESIISLQIIEYIRREAALHFGFAESISEAALTQGTPKIAVLSPPKRPPFQNLEMQNTMAMPDITVTAYSMGKVHPSIQLTGAVCLGAAVSLDGTIAADLSQLSNIESPPQIPTSDIEIDSRVEKTDRKIVIAHRSGQMDVLVELIGTEYVKTVTVFRTARRLFEGDVFFRI